jgi:hypothetical protein
MLACGADGARSFPSEPTDAVPVVEAVPRRIIDAEVEDLVGIDWVGVRQDGVVAVLQAQDDAVVFFDREGRRIGQFGRSGSGPGEFLQPIRGGWIGDTLWVADAETKRVILVAPDLVTSRTLPPLVSAGPISGESGGFAKYSLVAPYGMPRSDTYLAAALLPATDGGKTEAPSLFILNTDGGILEKVFAIPTSPESPTWTSPPFAWRPGWKVSPDASLIGSFFVVSDSVARVTVLELRGDTLLDRAYTLPARPIPRAAVDSALAAVVNGPLASIRPLSESDVASLRRAVPSSFPPVERIVLGSDSTVWLRVQGSVSGANEWMVLRPTGEPMKRVRFPRSSVLAAATDSVAWVVRSDEFDRESLVIFDVSGSPKAGG